LAFRILEFNRMLDVSGRMADGTRSSSECQDLSF
jgi:hypothetical protein